MAAALVGGLALLSIRAAAHSARESQDPGSSGAVRSYERRADGALRITDVRGSSAQNPIFSPDGSRLMYTRFLDGYNEGPSELLRLDVATGQEAVVVPAGGFNKVMSPSGGWVGNRIAYSSDEQGIDEVFVAVDDGSAAQRVTERYKGASSIEPVVHPRNPDKIAFEVAPRGSRAAHQLALVELDRARRVTDLTDDPRFDNRLPAFSPDGERLLFQRTEAGTDNWQVYVARMELDPVPRLLDVQRVSPSMADAYTDNAWSQDGRFILSSTTHGGLALPNVVAIAADGSGLAIRVTSSLDREDGAPSASPDGRWIAFESHIDEDEDSPTQIWIIPSPLASVTPGSVARSGAN